MLPAAPRHVRFGRKSVLFVVSYLHQEGGLVSVVAMNAGDLMHDAIKERRDTAKKGDPVQKCLECGSEFTAPYGDKRRGFCSHRCSRKFYKRMRRQNKRSQGNGPVERISPLAVYERDGWRCGICGKKVNSKLKYPNSKSVSLDHIIPLSMGGTHTWDNVQCSHLECNIEKEQ